MTDQRVFRGDKWTRLYGSPIPEGATVEVVRFYPKRKALVKHEGRHYLTMLWCLTKQEGSVE